MESSFEKLGKVRTCPSCGEVVNPLDVKCSSCGFELNITLSNRTLLEFLHQLMELGENKNDSISKKTDLISHFPIPNNKEDLFEFLTICIPQIEQEFSSLNKFEKKIYTAWLLKSQQLLIKAKSLFKNDSEFIEKTHELENKVLQKIKEIKKRRSFILAVKILTCISLVGFSFIVWDKLTNKKSNWELFVEIVNDKYGEEFELSKKTKVYKELMKEHENHMKSSYFELELPRNEFKLKKAELFKLASDLKYYSLAREKENIGNEIEMAALRDTSIALNPNFSFGLYAKGLYFLNKELPDSAIKYLDKAIAIRQDIWCFYWTRSEYYHEVRMFNKQLEDIEIALKIRPNECYLMFLKTICLSNLEWRSKSQKEWEKVKSHSDFIKLKEENPDGVEKLDRFLQD